MLNVTRGDAVTALPVDSDMALLAPTEAETEAEMVVDFDPLAVFQGLWNTELAQRYLPIPELPNAKYECVDGRLIMSPREGSANSFATVELAHLLRNGAREVGYRLYSAVNMELSPNRWIEPDLAVLREPVKNLTWVPADKVLMPIEFVSVSSRRRDRIDKPALCADAGVPWFMRVEVGRSRVGILVVAEASLGKVRFGLSPSPRQTAV